ncbi:MAG: bleomycin resistance protein [Chloroflexi bacterium]|nr:bleomycin resistance protein [Chloroflexota bacterium]
MAAITGSAPVLLVRDVVQAAAYFRDKLGFHDHRLYNEPPNFAILRRDGMAVMLSQLGAEQTVVPNWKVVEKMWDVYFWVDDVEAFYAEFQASGAIIDYTLYTAPHGVREFGVQDIDDHDIAFGQIIRS